MYIIKKIFVKSAISLFAGVAGAIGTQAGLMIWNRCLGEVKEEKPKQSIVTKEEFA